jgi:hypothetical protein
VIVARSAARGGSTQRHRRRVACRRVSPTRVTDDNILTGET